MTLDTLPQALDAEEAVLGAVLIDADAFAEVAALLAPGHFHLHKHRWIWDACLTLAGGGLPLDIVTVGETLERAGQLAEVGGMAYLTRLLTATPSAMHAESYARLVLEAALRRALLEQAAALARAAYTDDPAAAAHASARALEALALGGGEAEVGGIAGAVSAWYDDFEQYVKTGIIPGLTTGYPIIDQKTLGMKRGELLVLAARPSMGKCLGYGTKVVMVDGSLKEVQDVMAGDHLLGPDSQPRTVLSLARGWDHMYQIKQNHGITYRVNGAHILSLKRSKTEGPWTHGDTLNISVDDFVQKSSRFQRSFKGYKVGIELPDQSVPIEPYFLGMWLGDGSTNSSAICNTDSEVVEYLDQYAARRGDVVTAILSMTKAPMYRIGHGYTGGSAEHKAGTLQGQLRTMGLLGNKHIPDLYLRNSKKKRLELLAGLIDSDGHYLLSQKGPYEITVIQEELAQQIKFLCDSLGYRTSLHRKDSQFQGAPYVSYRVRFNGNVDEIPVRIPRKQAQPWADIRDWQVTGLEVVPDGVDAYFGFELDGDGLFLLEDMTVTHNTSLAAQMSVRQARAGLRVGVFALEGNRKGWVEAAALAELGLNKMTATEADLGRVVDKCNEYYRLPLAFYDRGYSSMAQLERAARQMQHDLGGLDVLWVDHLGYIDHARGEKSASLPYLIGLTTKRLAALAKDYDAAVGALCQLNRVSARAHEEPTLVDLRDSGEIEQDARQVWFIHRPGYYADPEPPAALGQEARLLVRKNHTGPTGRIDLSFVKATRRFAETEYHP